jgi:hypothetical protein
LLAFLPAMTRPILLLTGVLCVSACLCSPPAHARCALGSEDPQALAHWKAGGFATSDPIERASRAAALVDCLGDADPVLRDGIAFEALSTWMRGRQLDPATLRALLPRLLAQLDGDGDDGFRKPFSALVLSEVARTDRVQAWMTADERARMVDSAAAYLGSVRDYRGYVDGEGWRHGVAHGADWVLQLVLNKALQPAQVMALLSAVGMQVAPAGGHAYAFGEPGRLARPVAYAVARGDLEPSAIEAWLAGMVASLGARPAGNLQASWWIRRANLEDFLHALAYQLDGEQSPVLVAFAASVRATMRTLP